MVLISVTLLGIRFLTDAFLHIIPPTAAVYYRPHEELAAADNQLGTRYKKGVSINRVMPHGDLTAISPTASRTIIEQRAVSFTTDSFGFRNTFDYNNQSIILVGDSFIVGNGRTQSEILTEQLRQHYGLDTYSLAFVGGLKYYQKRILFFNKKTSEEQKFILFVFEGNDFPEKRNDNKTKVWDLAPITIYREYLKFFYDQYMTLFPNTRTKKFVSSILSRSQKILSENAFGKDVLVRQVGTKDMGFLRRYNAVSKRKTYQPTNDVEEVISGLRSSVDLIVFIPTKYRVYQELAQARAGLSGDDANRDEADRIVNLPNAQWDYVARHAKDLRIPAINLTEALKAESHRLIKSGQFTFWRDDTHWNGNGIAVAAREIVLFVSRLPKQEKRQWISSDTGHNLPTR